MSPKTYYIVFLVLLSAVLGYEVLMPLYTGEGSSFYSPDRGYKDLKQDLVNYDASLAKAQEIVGQADKLKQKYQTIKPEDLETLKVMVPDDIDEVKLRSEFSSILTDAGYSTNDLSVTKRGDSPTVLGAGSFLISFTLNDSSYENLKKMIYTLERSKRIFAIKSLSVVPGDKVGDMTKFTVTIETYYLKH